MDTRVTVRGMELTEQTYDAAAAAEARERTGRPHLTDARIAANATYQRRRARTAVDTLLEIDPEHYDEHTRRVLIETLPRLAEAGASPVELPPALQAAWCEYEDDERGACTLPEGHAGDHDLDPYAPPVSWVQAGYATFDERFAGGRNPADERNPLTCAHGLASCGPCGVLNGRPMHDNGDYRA